MHVPFSISIAKICRVYKCDPVDAYTTMGKTIKMKISERMFT